MAPTGFPDFQYQSLPRKTWLTERTDPLTGPVSEASTTHSDHKEGQMPERGWPSVTDGIDEWSQKARASGGKGIFGDGMHARHEPGAAIAMT